MRHARVSTTRPTSFSDSTGVDSGEGAWWLSLAQEAVLAAGTAQTVHDVTPQARAALLLRAGQPARAPEELKRALAIHRPVEGNLRAAHILGSLGAVNAAEGHFERALEYHEEAARLTANACGRD